MRAEVWNRCCRDLRTYLESALARARGGVVSVKLNRVLDVGRAHMWKMHYAQCLSRLLRSYKFNEVYVLTKQQAVELLNSLDALCAELQQKKRREPEQEEPVPPIRASEAVLIADGEKMSMVSFHLPRALLHALDEYAERMNLTRSDVIRTAIRQMLDKIAAKETAEEEEELEYIIAIW
jgi:hypothetical protein